MKPELEQGEEMKLQRHMGEGSNQKSATNQIKSNGKENPKVSTQILSPGDR